MRNFKIVVEYDGRRYFGWQRQAEKLTVQRVLEEAIGRITQEKVTVIGSGRTDTGVHALNQVAHFKTQSLIKPDKLLLGINSLLPDDVVVKKIEEVKESFHARFDAKSKVYMYQIFNYPTRPAVLRDYVWHIRKPLHVKEMEEALMALQGKHDFSSFCGHKIAGVSCVKEIREAYLKEKGNLIQVFIEADGFVRHMVRSIVGTLVEVGLGKRKPQDINGILAAKDRRMAGITAPPQGLFLVEVKY